MKILNTLQKDTC